MKDQPFDTLSSNQRRFIKALKHEDVAFIVIGGYAVRANGHLRQTEDLDLLVDCSQTNLARIREALVVVNAARIDEAIDLLSTSAQPVIHWFDNQLFRTIGIFRYEEVAEDAISVTVDGQSLRVIACSRLIESKRYAASRSTRGDKAAQDLEDATQLSEMGRESRPES